MHRRDFLKWTAMSGLTAMLTPLWRPGWARADLPPTIDYRAPDTLPTFIHVFLYGGPSELAGNLSNIADIRANSENAYPASLNPDSPGNDITPNHFWGAAGGQIMESLLDAGHLSIYRTIHRITDDNKGHGRSVAQNLVGGLDVSGPGIATTLAALLERYNPEGKTIDQLVMPFVSFEGDSHVFNQGDLSLSPVLRPMALDANLRNPYQRSRNWYLDRNDEDTNDVALESMARDVSALNAPRHAPVEASLLRRAELDAFISANFNAEVIDANLPMDPDTGMAVAYPDNTFGRNLKAAVSLAVNNPDTVFISLGNSGLGGWDDHSGALVSYPGRMQGLFEALAAAVRHMQLVSANHIVINVFGEFGRNVNLNNAMGWDHGNNQNLYTLGGAGIPGRTLGKLVGRTRRIGTPSMNRQFTAPTNDSYQCEPFSIAATIFSYFGVQNPDALTGEPAIDESDAVPDEKI